MRGKYNDVVRQFGELSAAEEKIYKAVLLEVGVGIDGGQVFYGTIGSNDRMTNTVIGDNVNSSSRLEGLTRVYQVPVICSEHIRMKVQTGVEQDEFLFVELDRVQVKGKTEGTQVYWPIPLAEMTDELQSNVQAFQQGLHLYYGGAWDEATRKFEECDLPLADVFLERTSAPVPESWNGIWAMQTK